MIENRVRSLVSENISTERQIPKVIKWKGINMIRTHSFLSTVKEIIDFSNEIDVTKIGIVGDPHSGKSTLRSAIIHSIHTISKYKWAVRIFNKEQLLNFKDTLKTLTPVNHILSFGDVSFLGAEAAKKQIEVVKQAHTEIRHLPGGKDVKIISIADYHYLLGLDKYLRQDNFKYVTTVGSSEFSNLEAMVGSKYGKMIKDFQKSRIKAVIKKYWTHSLSKKHEPFVYRYRNPFIPVLYYNGDSLRFIVTPTRQFLDPICSTCEEAEGEVNASLIPAETTLKQGDINFGPRNMEAAVKLLLYTNGLVTQGKHIVNALKWIEKARLKKLITLEACATYYHLSLTKTKLRKPLVLSDKEETEGNKIE